MIWSLPPRLDAAERPSATDTSSAFRFLLWQLRSSRAYIVALALTGLINELPAALTPLFLGMLIDKGVVAGDSDQIIIWTSLLTLAVIAMIVGNIGAHTFSVYAWNQSMFRIMKLVARKTRDLGHVMSRRAKTGEVLSVASSDAVNLGALTEVAGRATAALIGYIGVAIIVLNQSATLGWIVLLAAPAIVLITTPLTKPLQSAISLNRTQTSKLTSLATDIVAGLRILRGIGGERTFGNNYVEQSGRVRRTGVAMGTWFAALESVAMTLSGLLLVWLTYTGAHQLIAGTLTVGQLVAFFGYVFFLVEPIQTVFEFMVKWMGALVAAERARALFSESVPFVRTSGEPFPSNAALVDRRVGFVAEPGQLTMVVAAQPDDAAALADRLGGYLPTSGGIESADDTLKGRAAKQARALELEARRQQGETDLALASQPWGVELGGVDLNAATLGDVRETIFVSDASAMVFGETLQRTIDPHNRLTRERAEWAMTVAAAEDVYDGLPDGWSSQLQERGRGLSGGQRQRVVLARALANDPEVLVLVDPTSAVDSHTEARIAKRLQKARAGRTTIVMTASPLLLRHADKVFLLDGRTIVAQGTHQDLVANNADYRNIVSRGMGANE